ncbi:MAG: hypothetical protein DWQ08_11840, partial [Proteobacteria bacterium]
YGTGAVVGPLLGGFIMDYAGPRSLFLYMMTLSGGLGLYTVHRMRVRQPGKRKRLFVPKPETLYSPETLYNSVRNQIDRDIARTYRR